MKNLPKSTKLTEEKNHKEKNQISNESKAQWEVPKFEEIEVEGGPFSAPSSEVFGYRS